MAKPKLRFPEFIDEWEEKRLKDISSLVKRINDNKEHPIMMLSARNGFIRQSTKYSKDNARSSLKKYTLLYKGELAYNRGNSKTKKYGCIFTLTENSALVPYVYHCFRMKENNDSIFYGIYLNSRKIDKELRKIVSSSARMDGLLNVSKENFMSIRIRKPLLDEQQKIADFFSKIDEKINNQKTIVTDYEEMKKGLMQKLFNQEVRFKADDGSEYPEWKEKKLLELCDLVTDGDWIESNDQSESGIRLIQTGNIGLGIFYEKKEKTRYISEETFQRLHCKEVFAGDILVSRLPDPAGRCCIIPNTLKYKMITAVDCTIIRVNKDSYFKYIAQYMGYEAYFSDIQKMLAGGTRKRISRTNLKQIKIPTPCYKEQKKIADCLYVMDRKIEIEKQILESWTELKKALLQQMFV